MRAKREFHRVFNKLLRDRKITNEKLSGIIPYTKQYVGQVCNGKRVPRDEFIGQVGYALSLPDPVIHELTTLRDEAKMDLAAKTREYKVRRIQVLAEKITAEVWAKVERDTGKEFPEELWSDVSKIVYRVLRERVNLKGPI